MRRLLLVTLVAACAVLPAAAREVTPAEKRVIPSVADLPGCADPAVLDRVSGSFADKEAGFWNSSLTIVAYDHVRPLAWRPWGLDFLPRRFCTATATVSDGMRRRVDYSVREDMDLFGKGWGVEFCVTGLDRNLAFSPACRMARP
ncbi:MAG: hypothetical protein JWR08_2395 [Enterovirga sp.]|nr:hypothetical protein [Enterovirga sp.]